MPYDLYGGPSETSQKSNFRQTKLYRFLSRFQPNRVIRRLAILVLGLLIWYNIYVPRSEKEIEPLSPWSLVPPNPPTPFVLTSSQSSWYTPWKPSLSNALSPASLLNAPEFRPLCEKPSEDDLRYSTISSRQSNFTIYLALNLYNSQGVLPTFLHELPILLSFMGPRRFHVSILENGSNDLTPSLLVTLAKALDAIGTSYEIVVQGENFRADKANNRRIVELAYLRNAVMDTLYSGKAAKAMGIPRFDVVLFMNDIIWCTNDILEIMYEHVTEGAHQTCATDWGGNVVYDRWVVRSLAGLPFYSQEELVEYFNVRGGQPPYPRPLPSQKYDRERFEALKPFQVFSCWNGASVIDARAFSPPISTASAHPHDVPGNSQKHATNNPAGVRFRTAMNDASLITEKASECFLLSVDLWKRGMERIMIVPKSSVAYDLEQYERVRQDGGRTVDHPIGIEFSGHHLRNQSSHMAPLSDGSSRDDTITGKIQWVTDPPARVVYHDYAWWHEKERWGYWDEA